MEHLNHDIYEFMGRKINSAQVYIFVRLRYIEINFIYNYFEDTPEKVYEELIAENFFIKKAQFLLYMKIFANPNTRFISIKRFS